MSGWFIFFLTLHILFVVVAFGPTFAFPLMGGMIAKDPSRALALSTAMEQIEKRMTLPLAAIVPFLGVGLIFTAPGANINLWKSEWLIASIVLFTTAFFFALLVQSPNSTRMVKTLTSMPPGPPPSGGPPPEISALTKKLQRGGMFLSAMVLIILILMVWRPGNCQGIC